MITKITKIYNKTRWQTVSSTYHPTRDVLRSIISDESWDTTWNATGIDNVRMIRAMDSLTGVEQFVEDSF